MMSIIRILSFCGEGRIKHDLLVQPDLMRERKLNQEECNLFNVRPLGNDKLYKAWFKKYFT